MAVSPDIARRVAFLGLCLYMMATLAGTASGAAADADPAAFRAELQAMFPALERIGPLDGDPPVAVLYTAAEVLGYALFTADIAPIPAYSGRPINTLVGFDTRGVLRGLHIVHHEEPILVVGVSEAHMADYVAQYIGVSITDDVRVGGPPAEDREVIDAMSGATITTMVLNRSIVQSVRRAARAHGLLVDGPDGAVFAPPPPLWETVWRQRVAEIVILVAGLLALLLILLFQDWLARHPTFLLRVRTFYLVYTLGFIGVWGFAQLSVVNVLTFVRSLLGDFRWESFLIDPMMFLLWSFVAVTLLLWGRGVYCGWLCPFGALQELLHRLGQRLGIRGRELPGVVHERLLALKYIVLLGLFGVSLQSLTAAERLSEVEPFKTVFTLRFVRDWPFVLYAVLLLVLGLFIRKAFCRYLCPLGAALTFPGRFRAFDWLRRRKECGRPCQTCARECEVQAIRPTGEIVDTECHYCLDCQVTYWDARRCPPLAERRRKAELKARVKARTGG